MWLKCFDMIEQVSSKMMLKWVGAIILMPPTLIRQNGVVFSNSDYLHESGLGPVSVGMKMLLQQHH